MEVEGPLYELDRVKTYAEAGKVTFSLKAQDDFQELGFSKEAAIACLCSLDESEYRKSLQYEGLQPFDDYLARRHCPALGTLAKLYIKLRIPHPSVVDQVYVTSFHVSNGNL